MTSSIEFTLNGKRQSVVTETRRTLLEVLREDIGLTGTKYGCGEGECRACTVLIDGKSRPSCQVTIDEAAGQSIETIESLATGGSLSAVQEAFVSENAMQCGYCVPGMIMGTVALLRRNPNPSVTEITENLNKHLCRCCGYSNILRAVQRAARTMKEGK